MNEMDKRQYLSEGMLQEVAGGSVWETYYLISCRYPCCGYHYEGESLPEGIRDDRQSCCPVCFHETLEIDVEHNS